MANDWDVFVAYTSTDRDRARELAAALRALDLKVFLDQESQAPGDDWHRDVPRHLRGSQVVVALLSAATEEAHFQRNEVVAAIDLARTSELRLVPIRLADDAYEPFGLGTLHRVDMFDAAAVPGVAGQIAGVIPSRTAPSGRVVGDRVPRPPRVFVGRDEHLERLAAALREGSSSVVIQAIEGMGGVGKTSLAAAFAETYGPDFDIVWWIRAEEETTLLPDLADLAGPLGVVKQDDPADTATAVRQALESTPKRWLVVFDNAPDQRSIAEWLPRRGNGTALVTSRSTDFPAVDKVISVDILSPEQSEQLLRDRARPRNPTAASDDLTDVLDRLRGLPLALEQAAAWVSQSRHRTFARFVTLYDDAAKDPFLDGTRPLGYDHTATTTWRITIESATVAAPLAGRLMAMLGFFAPEAIPVPWLRSMADDDYFNATPDAIDEAIDALSTYSLVQIPADDMLQVHRLVQLAARRTASVEAESAAICTLRAQSPGDPTHPIRWPALAMLAPHALAVGDHAEKSLPHCAQDLWWVLDDIASYQRLSGSIRTAVTTGEASYKLATTHLGADDRHTLISRNNLAVICLAAGDSERAISLHEAELADCERVLGPDHRDTLTSRNNLAEAYRTIGDYDQAIPRHEANLIDRERVQGPDHPDTLTSRNNLALAYQDAGDPERAIPFFEANLTDFRRVQGPDHPNVLTSCNNLAEVYRAIGDLEQAIALHEANLADRERVLGSGHPSTLTTRNNLALAYQAAGDIQLAIALHEANLADLERVLGSDHPHTQASRTSLAVAKAAGVSR